MDYLRIAWLDYYDFLTTNGLSLLIPLVIILAWLFSGTVASTVAELRGHGPFFHFVAGLILPVLYPLFVLFFLPVKKAKNKSKQEDENVQHAEGVPPVKKAPSKPGGDGAIEEALTDTQQGKVYNQAFFHALSFDEEGNPRGPFMITVDGEEVRAERIIEAMPVVVVIETIDAANKAQRIRLPYDRIEGCIEQ